MALFIDQKTGKTSTTQLPGYQPFTGGSVEGGKYNAPAVITSKVADKNLGTINTAVNDWTTGIANQNIANANAKAMAEAAAQQSAAQAQNNQANKANTGAALDTKASADKTNQLLESLKASLSTGGKSTFAQAPAVEGKLTQDQELNVAYQRMNEGTATEADINNVNYAKGKGWLPTIDTASKPDATAPAEPTTAVDKTDPTKFDANGNALYDKDGNPTSFKFQQDLDTAHAEYIKKMDDIANGTFQLSPGEQAQVNSLRKTFDDLIAKQKVANKDYEGATDKMGIVSGRSRYAGEEQIGIAKTAIDQGVSKIADLEAKALASITDLKTALIDKDYKMIADKYKETQTYLTNKMKVLSDTQDAVRQAAKDLQADTTAKLNQQKLQADIASETIAPILLEGLTGDATADQKMIDDLSAFYNIDKNTILGAYGVAKSKDTAEKAKAELEKQKADAASNKLTSTTYKGVTTWWNAKGQKVDPKTGLPATNQGSSGSSAPTAPKVTKFTPSELKKLEQQDLLGADRQTQLDYLYTPSAEKKNEIVVKNAQARLAAGDKWGTVYNSVKKANPTLAVPLTDDYKQAIIDRGGDPNNYETNLDAVLGKETYYK